MRPARTRQIGAIAATVAVLLGAPASGETARDLVVVRPAGLAYIASPDPLNIWLVPTATIVNVGSPVGFSLGATADAYLSLYALSASGKVQLWLENVPIRADQAVPYPTPGVAIRAAPPLGDEQVLLVVTRAPFAGFGRGTVRSPLVLPYTHATFRQALDGRMSTIAPGDRASTEITIQVEGR